MKKILQNNIIISDRATAEIFCRDYRMPFGGFTGFQKIILSDFRFWDSKQNLIIKGEPGAGKTLIAELAFLSMPLYEPSRSRKILYLLPYRALLNEKYDYFQRGYDRSHFRIFRSSSDFYEEDRNILTADCEIGIMIYEKLDHAIYSGVGNDEIFYEYDLIVMDEFSIISTIDRGIVVNSILQRYVSLPLEKNKRRKARILALTVPECKTAEYISMGFQTISSEIRPVYINEAIIQADNGKLIPKNRDIPWPIELQNLPVKSQNSIKSSDEDIDDIKYYENRELLQYLIEAHRKLQHNIIVFCSSKENSRNLCRSISKIVKDKHILHGNWRERLSRIREQMGDNAYGCIDQQMLQSAGYGITYHNADLPAELRREIEKEFQKKDGRLDIIVSTETLAYGINCSADVIIIYDRIKPTNMDDFPNFMYGYVYMRYLNSVEYKNYIGRAGRLGYVENGETNTGYAYMFSKDASGTKRVQSRYYSECGRRFRSGRQLFAIKLRRRPETVTTMVFDQIQLSNDLYFYKKNVLDAVKFLSKKEKFLHENEIIDEVINRFIKLQLVEADNDVNFDKDNERYILTRIGEIVHGARIPYEALRCFQEIFYDIKNNGCSLFSLIYQLCKYNYDIHICRINRKKVSLEISVKKMILLFDNLEKNGEISERTYKSLKKKAEWLALEIERRDMNVNGYIYLSEEMASALNWFYDCIVLYLWAQGISIQKINVIYGLPAYYGSIKNQTRSIIHRMDCLIQYIQSFMDYQDYAEKIKEIKYSIRYGIPYFCIESIGFQVVPQTRPEICELLSITEREQCEEILRNLLPYHVTSTSSLSEIKNFRKELRQKIKEIKND